MWLKRKAKNRRFERQHLLDVKVQSQHLYQARVRFLGTTLAISTALLMLGLCFWHGLSWALDEFVYHNDTFAIEAVNVQTDGILPPDQLRRWAGAKPGDNLLALDLGRVKRDLELVPWIEAAAVERVLPRTLNIRVAEREPVAQILAFQAARPAGQAIPSQFLIDRDGYVMLPYSKTPAETTPVEWLPSFTGLSGAELRPGRRIETPIVHSALDFIAHFERSPMLALVELKSIDVSNPQYLQIMTAQGNDITFSLDRFEAQLSRWRRIHNHGLTRDRSIESLDLAVSNYVPVRWMLSNGAPAPGLKKTSRYKKKHV